MTSLQLHKGRFYSGGEVLLLPIFQYTRFAVISDSLRQQQLSFGALLLSLAGLALAVACSLGLAPPTSFTTGSTEVGLLPNPSLDAATAEGSAGLLEGLALLAAGVGGVAAAAEVVDGLEELSFAEGLAGGGLAG